jgi:hypothetical protein
LNCGSVRERGIDLTSTTKSTPDSLSRSTNSAIVLVEWPMVKNVLVLAPTKQWCSAARAASTQIVNVCFRDQKRLLSGRTAVPPSRQGVRELMGEIVLFFSRVLGAWW